MILDTSNAKDAQVLKLWLRIGLSVQILSSSKEWVTLNPEGRERWLNEHLAKGCTADASKFRLKPPA